MLLNPGLIVWATRSGSNCIINITFYFQEFIKGNWKRAWLWMWSQHANEQHICVIVHGKRHDIIENCELWVITNCHCLSPLEDLCFFVSDLISAIIFCVFLKSCLCPMFRLNRFYFCWRSTFKSGARKRKIIREMFRFMKHLDYLQKFRVPSSMSSHARIITQQTTTFILQREWSTLSTWSHKRTPTQNLFSSSQEVNWWKEATKEWRWEPVSMPKKSTPLNNKATLHHLRFRPKMPSQSTIDQ